jgi:hypothetical protein
MDLASYSRTSTHRRLFTWARGVTVTLVVLACTVCAYGQTGAPTRTQCKQWDDSYLFLLNLFLIGGVFLPLVLSLSLPPLLGKRIWMLTAPRARILAITSFLAVLLTAAFFGVPGVFGFGRMMFSGIDPAYLYCKTMNFGATGLLFGLMGPGVAALSQWLTVLALLAISCALGGVIALLVSEMLRSWFGLRARVGGGS